MTRLAALPALVLLSACTTPSAEAPASAASPTAATPDPARPLPLPLPDVVARVNGQEVRIRQILPLAKAALDKVAVGEREKKKPEVIRGALDTYVTRELLLQEALARGIVADTRAVERHYDQIRAEHADNEKWAAFLAEQAMDPQSFKAELRVQHTVSALLAREVEAWPVPEELAREAFEINPTGFGTPGAAQPPSFEAVRGEVERSIRGRRAEEIQAELVARLRSRAKVELFL